MKTALLVIDAQKVYTNPNSELYCEDSKKTLEKINKLISKFDKANWPIFLVRHIHKADGSDLGRMFDFAGEPEEDFNFKEGTEEIEFDDNLLNPLKTQQIIKARYSAFEGTDLKSKLDSLGVGRVVICGFMTNFCCESTAREAHDKDYFVDFVIDATGTPGTDNLSQKKIRKIVGELFEAGIAMVITAKECLEKDYAN